MGKMLTRDITSSRNATQNMRATTIGRVSSIDKDGKYVNSEVMSESELRNLRVSAPYGIASSAVDGAVVQIIVNPDNDNTAVGVIDQDRPNVRPGELILYTKYGQMIKLLEDGNIIILPAEGKRVIIGGDAPRAVARVDDAVSVDITIGGTKYTGTGKITSGSTKLSSD